MLSSVWQWIKDAKKDSFSPEQPQGMEVRVNVYDLIDYNKYGRWAGLGVFHSGIEVNGKEYAYGGHPFHTTGVFTMRPKTVPMGIAFVESKVVGYCSFSQEEFKKVLHDISTEFSGASYTLLGRNCNHFSNEFAKRLTGQEIPHFVNRLAYFGTLLPCLVPKGWINPPTAPFEEPFSENGLVPNERKTSLPTLNVIAVDEEAWEKTGLIKLVDVDEDDLSKGSSIKVVRLGNSHQDQVIVHQISQEEQSFTEKKTKIRSDKTYEATPSSSAALSLLNLSERATAKAESKPQKKNEEKEREKVIANGNTVLP